MYLKEQPYWEPGIYRIEPEDPILGGEFGIDNVQARQLANRTQYLLRWFLASHDAGGHHALKNADVLANAGIPESRVAFSDSTASVKQELDSLLARLAALEAMLDKIGSLSGSGVQDLYKAELLSWYYGSQGFDFCLFTDQFNFDDKNSGPWHVYKAVAGDDSIDIRIADDDPNRPKSGEWYLMTFSDIEHEPIPVLLNYDLQLERFVLSEPLPVSTSDATLSRTTWITTIGNAYSEAGGVFMSRYIETVAGYPAAYVTIRHTNPDDVITLKYYDGAWHDAELLGDAEGSATWRVSTDKPFRLMVSTATNDNITLIAAYPDPEWLVPEFVRTPFVGENFTIERYGAVYHDPMDKLVLETAATEDFAGSLTFEFSADRFAENYNDPVWSLTSVLYDTHEFTDGDVVWWRAKYYSQAGRSSRWTTPRADTYTEVS